MDSKEKAIGIGEISCVTPPMKIITYGLGSCIGIALYDQGTKIAGLSHIMLPYSYAFANRSNPMKYADLAIPELLMRMEANGARLKNIYAKIAGGASMFNFSDKNPGLDIGGRNAEAVKTTLRKYNIPILSEDLGGKSGRTMSIDAVTGKVFIKTIGHNIKEL
jgi:chemotaxis protein CheD